MSRVFDLSGTPIEGGITVVEASAGTGKTYCLTGLVLRLLLERRVEHLGEILVVTFTHAATDELVGRIRNALRDAHAAFDPEDPRRADREPFVRDLVDRHRDEGGAEILRRALLDFDELTVSTLHSFCKRMLEEHAFESGLPFDPELVANDDDLLLESSRDIWRRHLLPETEGPPTDGGLEGPGLLAAVAAHRRLTPETFLDDYRDWRRHPETEVLPPPEDLEIALGAVAAAARGVAAVFHRQRLRLWLTRLRPRGPLADRAAQNALLRDLEAFCGGHPEAVGAVERLTPDALARLLPRERVPDAGNHPFVAACGAFAAAVDRLEHALRGVVLREVHAHYGATKTSRSILAFDDLLHRLREALVDPQRGPALVKAVRERFGAALIDEFQDTDLVQYDIFRRLFHRGPLFLIGDPKQAIYRFRGADVFAYLEARSDAARRYTLERNWRSSAPLVAAVNGVFGSADRPFVLSDIPFQPAVAASAPGDRALVGDGGAPLQWQWLDREDSAERAEGKIRDAVAAEIVRLLECGLRLVDDGAEDADGGTPLEPGHIAVLVRTNAQALAFQEALRQLGVPAVVSRSGDIFRTDEAGELLRLLVAVLDPGHAAALRSACATLVWGDDASALGILDRDDVAWQRRVEQFEGYRERWRRQGFVAMVRTLVRQRGVRRRLLALEGGERRLTNLLHVVELAHEASHQRHLTPAGVVAWLRGERAAPTHDQDAAELRLESDRRAVTLTTVHKSKGLEYEVVFCPFLWQARPVAEPPVLAHLGPRHMVMDCGSDRLDHHLGLAEAERLGEDLRLAYVALTRARRRCYVAWGPIGRGSASASSALAYLLHRRQATLLDGVPGGPGGDDDARWVELGLADARARVDRWFGDLGDLVSSHGGIQSLRRLDEEPPPRRRDGDGGSQALAGVSTLQRGVLGRLKPWRIASFTSLSREAGHGEGEPTPAAADPASGETVGSTGEAPPSPPAAREIDAERPDRRDPPSVPAELAPPAGIFAFAKGPRAGDCLHDLFESCDYPAIIASPPEERSRAITEILQRHGLRKASRHPKAPPGFDPVATADGMLGRILRAPLPGAGFSLAQVTRARRLVEWQFYMPLGDLRPAQLAADLAAGASPRLRPYGRRLEGLSSQRLRGFLNGYVDLVCRHRGRYWIFDWKSNHLGNRVEDYDAEALERSMMEHHYILQYHLYSVALHRFLALRQPDYDYDRHFGGVFYVFLRGVADRPLPSPPRPPTAPARQLDLFGGDGDGTGGDPDHGEDGGAGILTGDGPTQGFFFDRPPRPLIEVLSRRFGAPSISDLTK